MRSNAVSTRDASGFLRDYFAHMSDDERDELVVLERATRQRVLGYHQAMIASTMDQGMVVNRARDGRTIDQCDSLLFSSLRYIALHKLGLEVEAQKAWHAILASRDGGKWLRHPSCAKKGTSRDMLLGLLAALTQRPEQYESVFRELVNYVSENRGFVGDGPIYVSYVSPGLGEIIRHFARVLGPDMDALPLNIRYGFSTMELDTYGAQAGYETHLNALLLWTELELTRSWDPNTEIRSLPQPLERLTRALWGVKLMDERWAWHAQRLVDQDPQNLFFRYLRLATADALTDRGRLMLLRELDGMPQFPVARLPADCDRSADYLWQRSSYKYLAAPKRACNVTYSGVDYLWMAALLMPRGSISDAELPSPVIAH